MIELLAPAGDAEKLKFALLYGADAVYIGGQNFSLRANAKNFSLEEIKDAVIYAHSLNKKVYVTVNIVFHDEDLEGLEEYLLYLDKCEVDAIICSDVAVLEICNKLSLKLERHISTQASILNAQAALFYKEMGASRLVLAREAMAADIKDIKETTGLELEAFIHGAMCTSISGRCILSNYCTNRDSNHGGCAQICRWKFIMIDEESGDEVADNFAMSPKDLNQTPNIKLMMDLGINSFKIEGRMRSVYYIATILHVYKRMFAKIVNNTINDAYTNYCLNILNRCANRETAAQFITKFPDASDQYYLSGRDEYSNQDFLGLVLENDGETITIEQRNNFKLGCAVQFFGPNIERINYVVDNLYDENLNPIDVAKHAQMIVKIKANLPVSKNDMMRIKVFDF